MNRSHGLHQAYGQLSWRLQSDRVDAYITRLGGHLAPVIFRLPTGRNVQPYAIAPWAKEGEPFPLGLPPLLHVLRGDFFCFPFGSNSTPYRGQHHLPHGDTANRRWSLVSLSSNQATQSTLPNILHAQLKLRNSDARIDKFITLLPGHTAIYQCHVIQGTSGSMPLGHHALLALPSTPDEGQLATSRFVHAQVLPTSFETPAAGGYSRLRPGYRFRSLRRVAVTYDPKGLRHVDLSRLPPECGFDDLVMLTADLRFRFAWSAVTFPQQGYVWFALRDPKILRHTILWLSHRGRHYAPWCGRHGPVLGVEDVTAYFHYGLAESIRPNALSRKGFATTLQLRRERPTRINYIMGVAPIPPTFRSVTAIHGVSDGIAIYSRRDSVVHAKIDLQFLQTGKFKTVHTMTSSAVATDQTF